MEHSVATVDGRLRRNERVVFRHLEAGAGGVLLELETGAYRRVNEIGALIWTLLEPSPTWAELMDAIRSRVPTAPPTMEAEVAAFVAGLVERGLVLRHSAGEGTPADDVDRPG